MRWPVGLWIRYEVNVLKGGIQVNWELNLTATWNHKVWLPSYSDNVAEYNLENPQISNPDLSERKASHRCLHARSSVSARLHQETGLKVWPWHETQLKQTNKRILIQLKQDNIGLTLENNPMTKNVSYIYFYYYFSSRYDTLPIYLSLTMRWTFFPPYTGQLKQAFLWKRGCAVSHF